MRRRIVFADRAEAGRLLAERLAGMNIADPLVLALPRGGVPVGAEIARRLGAPLDVALVRKLGAPDQPELAIGAVADGASPEIVLNADLVRAMAVSEAFIEAEATRELAAIEQRRRDYSDVRRTVAWTGRSVIVVDDGVATGMTMQAAVRSVRRQNPARLIAAFPVASSEALTRLGKDCNELVCLSAPRRFRSVGTFYRNFTQVSDEEVARLIEEAAARLPA